jgi:hypothetical protein
LPDGAHITEAVSIHGGSLEGYDFHALEVLQSFFEFRAGGESGIESVQFFTGERLWQAADDGLWSIDLVRAAMKAELGEDERPLRQVFDEFCLKEQLPDRREPPHGILVTYRDGLRAMVLGVGSSATRWNFAYRLE